MTWGKKKITKKNRMIWGKKMWGRKSMMQDEFKQL